MYNPYSFIDDTTFPVKIAFRLVGTGSSASYIVNVCKYQKSYLKGNSLYIVSNNFNLPTVITFNNESDAKVGFELFIRKINQYRINCKEASSGGGGVPSDPYAGPHHISFNSDDCLPPTECRTWVDSTYTQVLGVGNYETKKIELYFNGQKLIRNQEFEIVGNILKIKDNTNFNPMLPTNEGNYPYMIKIDMTINDILEAIIY